MTAKRKAKFTGVLARPIKPLTQPMNMLAAMARGELWKQWQEDRIRHVAREQIARAVPLMAHYGIERGTREPADFLLELVVCMGEDFIPGFRVAVKRTGRPTTWGPLQQLTLIKDVMDEQARGKRKKLSQLGACMRLVKPGRLYAGYTGVSLNRLCDRSKQALPNWEKILEHFPNLDETRRAQFHPKNQRSG